MAHLSASLTRLRSCLPGMDIHSGHLHNESTFRQGRIGKRSLMDHTADQRTSLGSLSQASPSCATSLIPSLTFASSSLYSNQSCSHHHDRSRLNERRGAIDLHSKNCLIPWSHAKPLIGCSSLKLFIVFSTGRTGLVSNSQDPGTGPPITVRNGVNNDSQYA